MGGREGGREGEGLFKRGSALLWEKGTAPFVRRGGE